jgi:hypothetical protein
MLVAIAINSGLNILVKLIQEYLSNLVHASKLFDARTTVFLYYDGMGHVDVLEDATSYTFYA